MGDEEYGVGAGGGGRGGGGVLPLASKLDAPGMVTDSRVAVAGRGCADSRVTDTRCWHCEEERDEKSNKI